MTILDKINAKRLVKELQKLNLAESEWIERLDSMKKAKILLDYNLFKIDDKLHIEIQVIESLDYIELKLNIV